MGWHFTANSPRFFLTTKDSLTRATLPIVPCEVEGCNAPYNLGCENRHGEAVCICPECDGAVNAVCSSDDVQDRNNCTVIRQSCLTGAKIEIEEDNPCGKFTCRLVIHGRIFPLDIRKPIKSVGRVLSPMMLLRLVNILGGLFYR